MREFIVIILFFFSQLLPAQQINNKAEIWAAYISSIRLSEKFSLWNDFHFVSSSFFASRHGLTYNLSKKAELTAGYAFVLTATAFSDKLSRKEHRPWGQAAGRFVLNPKVSYLYRLRYDGRIRQKVLNSELQPDWTFYSRIRLLNGIRFNLKTFSTDRKIHFDIQDELLFNFGRQIKEGIDQNRLYLLLGYSQNNLTLLGGYDWRVIPLGQKSFQFRHGFTFWVIHKINPLKKKQN